VKVMMFIAAKHRHLTGFHEFNLANCALFNFCKANALHNYLFHGILNACYVTRSNWSHHWACRVCLVLDGLSFCNSCL